MAARKSRSKKPKAPVEVVADSPTIDKEKMVEDGFEKTRARDKTGHFVKDDPSTPENEAYEWTKPVEVEETPIVDPPPSPTPKPVAKKKAAGSAPAKAAPKNSDYNELTHTEDALYGARRFRAKKSVKKGLS